MNKINCNVDNCSHNSTGICYANRIDVGGKGVTDACETCCGSFLDKRQYSTLTNNTNTDGPCDCTIINYVLQILYKLMGMIQKYIQKQYVLHLR